MAKKFQAQIREATHDEAALRSALADADIAPMLMVLVQLTGDLTILDEVAPLSVLPAEGGTLEARKEEGREDARSLSHEAILQEHL